MVFSLQAYFSKRHFLKFGVTLKKNYSIVFHGRGTDYLKFIHLWQEVIVESRHENVK